MSTFTPPADLVVPSLNPDVQGLPRRALRSAIGVAKTRNVFLYDSDTIAIDGAMPPASYNSDGSLHQTGLERLSAAFYGGTTYTVTATQAATLTAAGFSVV